MASYEYEIGTTLENMTNMGSCLWEEVWNRFYQLPVDIRLSYL